MVHPDEAVPAVMPLTRARVRLFQIVDAVLSGATPRVTLVHRDRGDAVVVLRLRDLEALERDLAALRARADVGPLRGLGTLHAPLERVLDTVRDRQERLAMQKASTVGEVAAASASPARRAVAEPKSVYRKRGSKP